MPLTTTISRPGTEVVINVSDGAPPGGAIVHVADVIATWDPAVLSAQSYQPMAGVAVLHDPVQGVLIWFKQLIPDTGRVYTIKFGPVPAGKTPYVVATATNSEKGQGANEGKPAAVYQFP